jgi:endonuclease III
MSFEVNIASAILSAYRQRQGVFETTTDLLENQIILGVDPGSEEHARFYFYLIYNDHGTKSATLYARFRQLYAEKPQLFDSAYLSKHSSGNGGPPSFLRDAISGLGLRYPKQSLISWWSNTMQLVRSYESKPINLFRSTSDAVELFGRVQSFRGYGPKTAGLLIRVIVGMGFHHLNNLRKVPVPVDVHDTRIAYWTGLYRPEGSGIDPGHLSEDAVHVKSVSALWQEAARQLHEPWPELDRALWLLGSRGCVGRRCQLCPVRQWCEEGLRVLNSGG